MGRIADAINGIKDFLNRIRMKKLSEGPEYVEFPENSNFIKENYSTEKSPETVKDENKAKQRATEIHEFFHITKQFSDFEDPINWAITKYSEIWRGEPEELDDFDKVAICCTAIKYKARYITDGRIGSVGGLVSLINRMSTDAKNNAKEYDNKRVIYSLEDYMEDPSRAITKMLEEKRERQENIRE